MPAKPTHPMNPTPAQTAEALEKSIQHWERLASGTTKPGEGPFEGSCALCRTHPNCEGCPVMLRTGKWCCYDTPYYKARASWDAGRNSNEFKRAARKELAFLKSLRTPNPRT
jgi:hypothetical protein